MIQDGGNSARARSNLKTKGRDPETSTEYSPTTTEVMVRLLFPPNIGIWEVASTALQLQAKSNQDFLNNMLTPMRIMTTAKRRVSWGLLSRFM